MVETPSALLFAVAAVLAGCRGVLGIEDPVVRADAVLDGAEPDDALADAAPVDAPGWGDAAPSGPRLLYLGQWSSGADVSTYTFAGVPLGAAALDRHVIVVSHGRSVQTAFGAATVVIGAATSATRVVSANETSLGGTSALHIAAVPDARTIDDITLDFTGGLGDRRAAIGVWVAYGLSSATPSDTAQIADGVAPVQLTLGVPADGVLVAGATIGNVLPGTTATWSGITEDYDLLVETTLATGASAVSSAAETRAVTLSASDGTIRVVAASFR